MAPNPRPTTAKRTTTRSRTAVADSVSAKNSDEKINVDDDAGDERERAPAAISETLPTTRATRSRTATASSSTSNAKVAASNENAEDDDNEAAAAATSSKAATTKRSRTTTARGTSKVAAAVSTAKANDEYDDAGESEPAVPAILSKKTSSIRSRPASRNTSKAKVANSAAGDDGEEQAMPATLSKTRSRPASRNTSKAKIADAADGNDGEEQAMPASLPKTSTTRTRPASRNTSKAKVAHAADDDDEEMQAVPAALPKTSTTRARPATRNPSKAKVADAPDDDDEREQAAAAASTKLPPKRTRTASNSKLTEDKNAGHAIDDADDAAPASVKSAISSKVAVARSTKKAKSTIAQQKAEAAAEPQQNREKATTTTIVPAAPNSSTPSAPGYSIFVAGGNDSYQLGILGLTGKKPHPGPPELTAEKLDSMIEREDEDDEITDKRAKFGDEPLTERVVHAIENSRLFSPVAWWKRPVAQVAAGGLHSVVLFSDNLSVVTFGLNDAYQRGLPSATRVPPLHIPNHHTGPDEQSFPDFFPSLLENNSGISIGRIAQIVAGDSFTAVLSDAGGHVYITGTLRDASGVMKAYSNGLERVTGHLAGQSSTASAHVPIRKITAGQNHLAVIDEDGKVFTMGRCQEGQLGRLHKVRDAMGRMHARALKLDRVQASRSQLQLQQAGRGGGRTRRKTPDAAAAGAAATRGVSESSDSASITDGDASTKRPRRGVAGAALHSKTVDNFADVWATPLGLFMRDKYSDAIYACGSNSFGQLGLPLSWRLLRETGGFKFGAFGNVRKVVGYFQGQRVVKFGKDAPPPIPKAAIVVVPAAVVKPPTPPTTAPQSSTTNVLNGKHSVVEANSSAVDAVPAAEPQSVEEMSEPKRKKQRVEEPPPSPAAAATTSSNIATTAAAAVTTSSFNTTSAAVVAAAADPHIISSDIIVERPEHVPALDGLDIIDIAGGETHTLALSRTGNVYVFGSNKYYALGLEEANLRQTFVDDMTKQQNGDLPEFADDDGDDEMNEEKSDNVAAATAASPLKILVNDPVISERVHDAIFVPVTRLQTTTTAASSSSSRLLGQRAVGVIAAAGRQSYFVTRDDKKLYRCGDNVSKLMLIANMNELEDLEYEERRDFVKHQDDVTDVRLIRPLLYDSGKSLKKTDRIVAVSARAQHLLLLVDCNSSSSDDAAAAAATSAKGE